MWLNVLEGAEHQNICRIKILGINKVQSTEILNNITVRCTLISRT
jgi:hypothetical protein